MFVVYSNRDEVIVTTRKREVECVKEFFTEGGRDIEEYERQEVKGGCGVSFSASITQDW